MEFELPNLGYHQDSGELLVGYSMSRVIYHSNHGAMRDPFQGLSSPWHSSDWLLELNARK